MSFTRGILFMLPPAIVLWGIILYPAFASPPIPTIVINNEIPATTVIATTETTELTNVSGLSDVDRDSIRGSAIAMCLGASQFDYAKGWQGSGAGSWWKNETAVCASAAKRIDDILITGGVGCDTNFEDCGGVISGNWHF